MVNIPNAVWIDEEGMIVRPAEPAAIARPRGEGPEWRGEISPDLPERLQEMLREARKIPSQAAEYTNAIRDWVANGASSRFALPPDEVIERSGPRGEPEARAAALFELGQHLWHSGRQDLSPKYWREAHRLQPDNWTYKRQAWSLADPLQGPTDLYDSDWLSDIRKVGPENYFPKLQL